jgi:hypothetical protein
VQNLLNTGLHGQIKKCSYIFSVKRDCYLNKKCNKWLAGIGMRRINELPGALAPGSN